MPRPVKIDFVSDVACPWCAIGLAALIWGIIVLIKIITGMGGSKAAFALMGKKDPLYGASMSYLPTMGGRAVALAKKILLGEKFEKDIIEPTIVVTSANVSKYVDEAY